LEFYFLIFHISMDLLFWFLVASIPLSSAKAFGSLF